MFVPLDFAIGTGCRRVIRKNSIGALLGENVSKSRPLTTLQARPHAMHFKPILDFGEGHRSRGTVARQPLARPSDRLDDRNGRGHIDAREAGPIT
jgi:hypothetical protein